MSGSNRTFGRPLTGAGALAVVEQHTTIKHPYGQGSILFLHFQVAGIHLSAQLWLKFG